MQGKRFSDFNRRITVPENMAKLLFENASCDCSYYMYFQDFKNCMSSLTIKDLANKEIATEIGDNDRIPFFIYDDNGILTETRSMKFLDIQNALVGGYACVSFEDGDNPYSLSLTNQNEYYVVTSCCDSNDLLDSINFSDSNGRMTILKEGIYDCNVTIVFDSGVNNTDEFEIGMFVNGTLHNNKMPFYDNNSPANISFGGTFDANTNDEVDIRIRRTTSNSVDLDILYCMFRINKIK